VPMTAEQWRQIEALYEAARKQPADNRAAWLAQACPDAVLRGEVESLLAQSIDSFLENAPFSLALAAGVRLGNFELVELLGRGGMGEVWRAHDPRLKRDVAIKILPVTFTGDQERISRFEQEARSASALNHPNIVAVYDIGHEDGKYWIVSELVDGESLRALICHGPVPVDKATAIAAQIASALVAAHAAGIVHRDLKPGNIMLHRDGRVKLVDFGLAKRARATAGDTTVTSSGVVMGTAGYMAPEQVRGGQIDHRADVFSFGVVLYEMLSGKQAFRGDSSVELMHAILKDEPPALPPVTPATLDRIVRRCLQKDPANRFQSAADLGFALEATSPVRRSRARWPIGVSAVVVFLAVAISWLTRPPPPPRVTGMDQVSHEGQLTESTICPLLSDGPNLFYTGASRIFHVSATLGESVPLPMQTGGWLMDLSHARNEFLACGPVGFQTCELWRSRCSADRDAALEVSSPGVMRVGRRMGGASFTQTTANFTWRTATAMRSGSWQRLQATSTSLAGRPMGPESEPRPHPTASRCGFGMSVPTAAACTRCYPIGIRPGRCGRELGPQTAVISSSSRKRRSGLCARRSAGFSPATSLLN
jgi:serine/threonine protein kinase